MVLLFFLNALFCTDCGIFTTLIDNMSVCFSSATVQMDWKCLVYKSSGNKLLNS